MVKYSKNAVSLKVQYSLIYRLSLLGSILVCILAFISIPRTILTVSKYVLPTSESPVLIFEPPPVTEQLREARPEQPAVIVPTDNPDAIEDVPIDFIVNGWEPAANIELPPPPTARFIPHTEEPHPIGGLQALARNIIYPPIAREAGIEGTVLVQLFIDKTGQVKYVTVLKGVEKTGLDEAAVSAILATEWAPAYQQDKPVGIWMTIPIRFSLR